MVKRKKDDDDGLHAGRGLNTFKNRMSVISYTCDNVEFYYYDGQIPVETFEDFSTGNDKLTRNFVGARGIEMMETTQNSATTHAYPLYDTHGNMVATLSKNSAGTSWSLGNERSYDVWGSVRSGAATGGPKGRYVANLGHVADDESGLIYMRARYYEPETGRFVSEDPAMDGSNWYVYCGNDPINKVDFTGLVTQDTFLLGQMFISFALVMLSKAVADFSKAYAELKIALVRAMQAQAEYGYLDGMAPGAGTALGLGMNMGAIADGLAGLTGAANSVSLGIQAYYIGIMLMFGDPMDTTILNMALDFIGERAEGMKFWD
ncbi:hypothetical protein C0431_14410 [bacterium]|nr:hypothetical protein [bacterium]